MDPGGMDSQNGSLLPESGIMEVNFPTEKKSYLKSIKQCARNISINKQPAESPKYINDYYFSGPEWVPVELPGDINRGTSVLESKVKALKEKRNAINTPAEAVSHEQTSPKKAKAHKGKSLSETATQDVVVEQQAQIRTYLTDVLLDSTDYPQCKQEESQEIIFASLCSHDFEPLERPKSAEETTGLDWHSPKQSRRLTGKKLLDKKWSSVNTRKRETPNSPRGASSLKDLSFTQKYFEETNGREDHFIQDKEFERRAFVYKDDPCGLVTTGRLWKAESWDSLASVGSNASALSLAERVERNRSILQEMLRVSQLNSHSSQELHAAHHHKKETPAFGNDDLEILTNDIDWDSGVSLQDSEGYRAFVPNQELELSPRHEQAKQLLQRARMKARTNPLRASHNILPTFPQERRDGCRMPAANAKNFFAKGEDSRTSGNLSDSSSGESSCDQQRKRGPSPSRVRFEDESARDAEVRYMERLQQRQKRVLDSVLLSLGQGPLVSKPDLSDYISGGFQRKENSITKPGWKQQSSGQTTGVLACDSDRGYSEKEKPLLVNAEGKCSACGSYVNNLAANSISDVRVNQTGKGTDQTVNVSQENKDLAQKNESSTSQEDSRTRTLGPKGTPLWILPSRQRVYTERIRETYIGEVTCIDDVDSALDSATDTSDSYRTDSEEAGTSSQPSVSQNHLHSGTGLDPSPSCVLQKEKKTEVEQRRTNGNCSTNGEVCNSVLGISKVENKSTDNETINSNSKRTSKIKSEVTKVSASKAIGGFPRGNQPADLQQLVKKGRSQGHTKIPKAQLRQPTPTVHSQSSHPVPDGVKESVDRQPVETSIYTHKLANNSSQAKQVKGASEQLTKELAASYNTVYRVPVPPTSGKEHSSPMPYRRTVLTGSYKQTNQNAEQIEQDSNLLMFSASSNNVHHMHVSGGEEQSMLQNPKMLSKSQLLALSTNNCNNKHAKLQPKHSATATMKSTNEQLQDSQKLRKKQGPTSSACDVPSLTSNAISPAAISLSLTTDETNFTTSSQSISKEVPVAEPQKTKPVQASADRCKPSAVYPEPKKKQFAKKGSTPSSSTSGLKKFFITLSQSTKQRLGRFRCYSMEQICDPDPRTAVSTEEQSPSTTSSPKMKKAPSLQSLQLVSPFCRPKKASSVQNLHSLLGKTDRSSAYMLGEPKDGEAAASRKAGAQPQRSLSVEDIGSPNLLRNVGRVVEVFPDGTSQLELQRTPQGNFGFRVSSGHGRPDTGIYIQEMADASTAKLYAGLLGVGDEILEVNGAKVAGLGLAQINELLLWADTLSVRVLRQRPIRW